MKRAYYETPKASKIMRLFWKIAGGDEYILNKATYSDQLKYTTLGGVVLATGAMAALAGGYAFYTIFEKRGSALDDNLDISTMFLSIFFGLIWGAVIFNIDRFIVTSTGKGDGTEKITWGEFTSAIPRIIMGLIISITISKPIEIRMFKTEIDNELHSEQQVVQKEFEIKTRKNFEDRLKLPEDELNRFLLERSDLILRIKNAEKEHTDQLQGRAGAPAGDGKLAQALLEIKNNLIIELDEFDNTNKERINELKSKKKKLISLMDKELSNNEKVAAGLDGLLERIKLCHKIAGFWISLFITLLFIAIELTPIFFKLMLIKSTYDFMDENVKELIKAESGILVEYDYYPDKEGSAKDLVIHVEKEKQMIEQRELLELQKRLTKYAIEKYEESMKLKIDENPSKFITSQQYEA